MSTAPAAPPTQSRYIRLAPGEPAPWFHARSTGNPRYAFDTAAGRTLVLCFYVSATEPSGKAALDAMEKNRGLFNDADASFFGVSLDPRDESEGRVRESLPGVRHFFDFDGAIARLYGALPEDAKPGSGPMRVRQMWVIINPTMRIAAIVPFAEAGPDHEKVFEIIRRQPKAGETVGFPVQAPVLILDNIFEPEFCRHLIAQYERHGGEESGFVREVGGKTTMVHDHAHKRRRDFTIADPELIRQTQYRIRRKVAPEILKVHAFEATRMERYIVSCYAAEDNAHFRAHRDNTTKGTAHRRFAVSINLNEDFAGGEVSFPEYGPRGFKVPAGGAVVFSCSLLHAVSPVTRGRRYAFLPFLYDEQAAKIREENNRFLDDSIGAYNAGAAQAPAPPGG